MFIEREAGVFLGGFVEERYSLAARGTPVPDIETVAQRDEWI